MVACILGYASSEKSTNYVGVRDEASSVVAWPSA
jgi:hypothetical protein